MHSGATVHSAHRVSSPTPCSFFVIQWRRAVFKKFGAKTHDFLDDIEQTLFVPALAGTAAIAGCIWVLASTAPPFTPAMLHVDDPGGNPCQIVANASWRAAHACGPSPSPFDPAGTLVCDGGTIEPFAEYISPIGACHAARSYYSVVTKVYAAFGLWSSMIAFVWHQLLRRTSDCKSARFPRLTELSHIGLHALLGVSAPMFLAVMLRDSLEPTWVTAIIFDA